MMTCPCTLYQYYLILDHIIIMIYITYIVISIISIILLLDGHDIPEDFFNKKNDQHHIYVENGVAYVCNQKCISSKWLVAQADEICQQQEKR